MLAIGCCGPPPPSDVLADIGHAPGTPGVGAHGLTFNRFHDPNPQIPILTPLMTTRASGSTIVVSQGRGDFAAFAAPTDNMGNAPYQQLDTAHPYTQYPQSGTAVYAFPAVLGGSGDVLTSQTPHDDEITVAAVEIVDGTHVQAAAWTEVLGGNKLTSATVTTTGPASLVAYWWGDADGSVGHTAVPDSGFTVVEKLLDQGSLVQCAMAVKTVAAAGSYNVTWAATPIQGAQMWLIAIQ